MHTGASKWKKMSKSLGNKVPNQFEALEGYDANTVRYCLVHVRLQQVQKWCEFNIFLFSVFIYKSTRMASLSIGVVIAMVYLQENSECIQTCSGPLAQVEVHYRIMSSSNTIYCWKDQLEMMVWWLSQLLGSLSRTSIHLWIASCVQHQWKWRFGVKVPLLTL